VIAYKLVRRRRDGTLGPLFINARLRIPFGEWLEAEEHETKGFAFRPGWHCCLGTDGAPHLKQDGVNRVWTRVEVADFEYVDRPESQGGRWLLANRIRFEEVIA
jgi:hypothetical protein